LQAGQAGGGEAFAPLADRVTVAVELLGDVLVGGVVVGSSLEDEPAAEGERLGSRAGADQVLELLAEVGGELQTRGKRTRHDLPPCTGMSSQKVREVIMAGRGTFVQTLAANL
jgi:hypothetical protein